jgi:hypothetical protein
LLAVNKLVEQKGEVPTGFEFDEETPTDVLKAALHIVIFGDEQATAAKREWWKELRAWATLCVSAVAATAAIIAAVRS